MTDAAADTPGLSAIEARCAEVHGDLEPRVMATLIKHRLGGPDPLDGVYFYPVAEPSPHWHLVTTGFSELYEKEGDDPEVSGFGFELTMRLARFAEDQDPPAWVCNFLQNIARYVFETGNVFGAGHKVNCNGPIASEEETAIEAIAFTDDPDLGELQTPNGAVRFLQVVGLTMDEYTLVERWNTESLIDEMRRENPQLILDLKRRSILDDCNLAARVEERVRAEGSSQETTLVKELSWTHEGEASTLEVGANAVEALKQMLQGRTLHGREFTLLGPERGVAFRPGDAAAVSHEDDLLVIQLPGALAEAMLQDLVPQRGEYSWEGLPGFVLTITPSEIRDANTGEVVRVLG